MRKTKFCHMHVLIFNQVILVHVHVQVLYIIILSSVHNVLTGEVNKTIVSADPNPQMKEVTVEPMV